MTSDRWLVADEWFASFIRDLESHAGRVVRLKREAGRGIPKHHRAAVEYEQQTENYLKFLRHESRNHAPNRDDENSQVPRLA